MLLLSPHTLHPPLAPEEVAKSRTGFGAFTTNHPMFPASDKLIHMTAYGEVMVATADVVGDCSTLG